MAGKTIVVAGAGGNIGSHVVCSLARLPDVERVVLIDRDVYETRNLLNQDITLRDIGEPKVLVQARRLAEIRPDLQVSAIHAPLESLPLGFWRGDLIVACLDSRAARQFVNEQAWRVGTPWLDSGVLGSECLARVNIYIPALDAPCLECAWSANDYRLLEQRYPCSGREDTPAPNTASAEIGGLAAALLAIECRKMLAGEFDCAAIGRQVTVNARWHQLTVTSFRRARTCRFDHAMWRIETLSCCTAEVRIKDLLAIAESVRVAGQRFVGRVVCSRCGSEKRGFGLDTVRHQCCCCEIPMAPTGFDIVECLDDELPESIKDMTLAETGLRYGDVIEAGGRYYELTHE